MKIKKIQPLIEVLVVSILLFLAHKLFFYCNETNIKHQNFYFKLETIYGFFTISSLFIVSLLLFIKQKSKDNVGLTFMLITCIKIGASLTILMPILNSKTSTIGLEKINFFIIFSFFLLTETVVTIKILDNNQ